MFVGVVVENFHKCREVTRAEELARKAEKRAKRLHKKKEKAKRLPYYARYCAIRLWTNRLVTSTYFDLAIAIIIGLNIVTMSMEHYLMPTMMIRTLKIFNYFFTIVFVIEALLKIYALGFLRFMKNKWNQLDVTIVVLSIIGITLEEMKSAVLPINPTIIRVMRVLRIARVFKLLKMASGIRQLLDTVIQALPQVGNLGLLFFLLFYIFAALGVELFGRIECNHEHVCEGLGQHATFKDFGYAFLTLFRVATGDNWNGILKDTLREDCDNSEGCVSNCCVNNIIAPLYFVIFVLMAQFVLVNVVVAVLMKHLEEAHKLADEEDDEYDDEDDDLRAPNKPLRMTALQPASISEGSTLCKTENVPDGQDNSCSRQALNNATPVESLDIAVKSIVKNKLNNEPEEVATQENLSDLLYVKQPVVRFRSLPDGFTFSTPKYNKDKNVLNPDEVELKFEPPTTSGSLVPGSSKMNNNTYQSLAPAKQKKVNNCDQTHISTKPQHRSSRQTNDSSSSSSHSSSDSDISSSRRSLRCLHHPVKSHSHGAKHPEERHMSDKERPPLISQNIDNLTITYHPTSSPSPSPCLRHRPCPRNSPGKWPPKQGKDTAPPGPVEGSDTRSLTVPHEPVHAKVVPHKKPQIPIKQKKPTKEGYLFPELESEVPSETTRLLETEMDTPDKQTVDVPKPDPCPNDQGVSESGHSNQQTPSSGQITKEPGPSVETQNSDDYPTTSGQQQHTNNTPSTTTH